MKSANGASRSLRGSCLWSLPVVVMALLVLPAGRPASAQRPLTFQHARELASYLDVVKIAEPVVFDRLAVYPVIVSGPPLLRGRWLTLDAALTSGALAITEGRARTVPVVWIENASLEEHSVPDEGRNDPLAYAKP